MPLQRYGGEEGKCARFQKKNRAHFILERGYCMASNARAFWVR